MKMGTSILEVEISDMMQFFDFAHLPEHLQRVSAPFYSLAWGIFSNLETSKEKYESLHRLLESKDCAVRSALQTKKD